MHLITIFAYLGLFKFDFYVACTNISTERDNFEITGVHFQNHVICSHAVDVIYYIGIERKRIIFEEFAKVIKSFGMISKAYIYKYKNNKPSKNFYDKYFGLKFTIILKQNENMKHTLPVNVDIIVKDLLKKILFSE